MGSRWSKALRYSLQSSTQVYMFCWAPPVCLTTITRIEIVKCSLCNQELPIWGGWGWGRVFLAVAFCSLALRKRIEAHLQKCDCFLAVVIGDRPTDYTLQKSSASHGLLHLPSRHELIRRPSWNYLRSWQLSVVTGADPREWDIAILEKRHRALLMQPALRLWLLTHIYRIQMYS